MLCCCAMCRLGPACPGLHRARCPLQPHLSPQVGNLGLLFMLLFFIYAALGVELFGKLGEQLLMQACPGSGV